MARGVRRIRVDAEREPSFHETVDEIVRRLESESASPDRPDNRDALGGPSRLDAAAMAPIFAKIGVGPSGDARNMADWQTQAVASLPREPLAKIGVFARERFPEQEPSEAIRRYGVLDGRIIYIDRDGSAKWEEPSSFDALASPSRYVASWAGPAMPMAGGFGGGLLGGLAGATGGPGGSYVAGTYGAGGGSALGEWLRQELARQYAGETMNDRDRWINTALSGAIGMSGYAMARPVVQAVVQKYSHAYPPLAGALAQWPLRWAVGGATNAMSRDSIERVRAYDEFD